MGIGVAAYRTTAIIAIAAGAVVRVVGKDKISIPCPQMTIN
jgi:hypothetical protein